jgi:hypothetical protein
VHSVNFAAKLVHTRRALSSTIANSHQEPVSGQACNPLDPHWFFLSLLRWRSCTVLGTKVAPFFYLMWGVAFAACVAFSFIGNLLAVSGGFTKPPCDWGNYWAFEDRVTGSTWGIGASVLFLHLLTMRL